MLKNVKDFYNNNPIFSKIVILVIVACASYSWGRFDAPTKTVEIIKTAEEIKDVEKTKDTTKESENKIVDTNENKHVHRETIEEVKPDGTKIVKHIEDVNETKVIKEVEIKYVDKVVEVEKTVEIERKVEVEKIVEKDKSNWGVSARVGVDFMKLTNQPFPVTIGLQVDRRIIGPFKVGVWVNTETTFKSVTGGVSLGFEF